MEVAVVEAAAARRHLQPHLDVHLDAAAPALGLGEHELAEQRRRTCRGGRRGRNNCAELRQNCARIAHPSRSPPPRRAPTRRTARRRRRASPPPGWSRCRITARRARGGRRGAPRRRPSGGVSTSCGGRGGGSGEMGGRVRHGGGEGGWGRRAGGAGWGGGGGGGGRRRRRRRRARLRQRVLVGDLQLVLLHLRELRQQLGGRRLDGGVGQLEQRDQRAEDAVGDEDGQALHERDGGKASE